MQTRRIMHLDMDAFYASVEVLDNPSLRGKPVIVGGTGPRSVVCACSYEARPMGVRSAIPMRRARELCPEAVFLRPRMSRYVDVSRGIFEYLASQVELVEKVSVDEAYLDITREAPGDDAAWGLGERLRGAIRERFGLVCSVGIGPCKFISKIASDLRKPDALVLVRPDEAQGFLDPLPVEKIPGVGKVGMRKLHGLDVRTIMELRGLPREMLVGGFGKWGGRLYDFARGIDSRPVATSRERKSVGAERTFDTDVRDLVFLLERIGELSERVAVRLESLGVAAHTVTLKVRYRDFSLVTRSESFERPVGRADELASVAGELLRRTEAGRRYVRLVGVSASGLCRPAGVDELPLF